MVKKTIWKYTIPIKDYHSIEMPFGAEILSFQLQCGVPTIWVLMDTVGEITNRRFRLIGTGHDIVEAGLKYIGTIKMMEEILTYHLFEY